MSYSQTVPAKNECCATCVMWGGQYTIPRLGMPRSRVRALQGIAMCRYWNALRTPRGGGGNCPGYKKKYELG